MDIKKITVNGINFASNEYEFVNDSRNTRNGFAHDTKLFKNNVLIAENTAHYLNRTWECYRYQTVMKGCVSGLIMEMNERFISDYKAENNIKRLTAEKRAEVNKRFEDLAEIKELREVYNQL